MVTPELLPVAPEEEPLVEPELEPLVDPELDPEEELELLLPELEPELLVEPELDPELELDELPAPWRCHHHSTSVLPAPGMTPLSPVSLPDAVESEAFGPQAPTSTAPKPRAPIVR